MCGQFCSTILFRRLTLRIAAFSFWISARSVLGDPYYHTKKISTLCVCLPTPTAQTAHRIRTKFHMYILWTTGTYADPENPGFDFPKKKEIGKTGFLGDSGHFGRHFLRDYNRYQQNHARSFSKYHQLSNESIFTSQLRKL